MRPKTVATAWSTISLPAEYIDELEAEGRRTGGISKSRLMQLAWRLSRKQIRTLSREQALRSLLLPEPLSRTG